MLRAASQVYPRPRLKLAAGQKFVEQDHNIGVRPEAAVTNRDGARLSSAAAGGNATGRHELNASVGWHLDALRLGTAALRPSATDRHFRSHPTTFHGPEIKMDTTAHGFNLALDSRNKKPRHHQVQGKPWETLKHSDQS